MNETASNENQEVAILGGGCFWCLDALYRKIRGVIEVESGYAGGYRINLTYQEVCSGESGHAEVVRIVFDVQQISYQDILRVFFAVHDPTTLNRQGNDVGTQYRSVIFTNSWEQQEQAEALIAELSPYFDDEIVTQISKHEVYYAAEDYHQNYFAKNPQVGYCAAVISPKLIELKQKLKHFLKED